MDEIQMTPTAATILQARAQRQLDADLCSCHVTAEQVADLSAAYLDAIDRLAQIATLSRQGLRALAKQHLARTGQALIEIGQLCYADIEPRNVAEMADLPIDNVGNP